MQQRVVQGLDEEKGGHTLAHHGPPRAGREPGGHQTGMDKSLKDQLT